MPVCHDDGTRNKIWECSLPFGNILLLICKMDAALIETSGLDQLKLNAGDVLRLRSKVTPLCEVPEPGRPDTRPDQCLPLSPAETFSRWPVMSKTPA